MTLTSDIHFRSGDTPGARYLSGRVTYDEQYRAGRLCTRYWSPSGQVWPEMHLQNQRWLPDQPADAFQLAIDGQNLAGSYEWESAQVTPDSSGYRSGDGAVSHGVITLLHRAAQIEVKVHTRIDGGPFIIRWLEVTNHASHTVGITSVAPFSGALWAHRAGEHLDVPDGLPFALAYAHQFSWGQEGDLWFEPLAAGVKVVDGGKLGRSGWGRPAFWAYDRCNGQTFVCELAWGGNYAFALDCRLQEAHNPQMHQVSRQAELYFRMSLSGYDPVLRSLAAGETLRTPPVHLGFFQEETDKIVQATHAHVRNVVMPERVSGRYVEIEANHRGYLCDRENEPDLLRDVEVAQSIGTEMYVIDAGWYGNEPNLWWKNVGDWHAGAWLPNGLEPVPERAHQLGMKFGLWVEVEAVGENSTLRREHPDWLYRRDGEPVANGRALDLTNPTVAAWVQSEIERVIERYKLDMFRIDHNHLLSPSGNRAMDGTTEDLTWRYYDALYGIFERVRAKYPAVVFQDCAGGGGRLDWGTLHRFNNAELSDWMRMPRGLKILNGVTMSLPPEILLRTFGTEVGELDLEGDVDAQLRLVCLCRPIFRGIAPSREEMSAFLQERIDHHLKVYREFIRPVMIDGRVFHHTPFIKHTQLSPWCVLEYASADGARAVAGVFRTGDAPEPVYHLAPRGLDPARTYRVTLDNRGQAFCLSGAELLLHGMDLRLELPQSSELVLFEALTESDAH
jgi:alpha-galactosidase